MTIRRKKMSKKQQVESRKDQMDKKGLMQLAQLDDPLENIDLELMNRFKEAHDKAVRKGYKGTLEQYVKEVPISELRELSGFADGGPVDFSGLDIPTMKAIFRSENGRDAKSVKELIKGVKMYFKNMDLKGMPFKADGGLISSYKANLRKP